MGLKGKIEAIIYAAEDPVSLEQISLLVKEPALQELAEERARVEAAEAAPEPQAESTEQAQSEPSDKVAAEDATSQTVEPQPETHPDSTSELECVSASPADAAGDPVKGSAAEQSESSGADTNIAAAAPNPDVTASPEITSDTPTPEPPIAVTNAEQPFAEASEKAKSNVAGKRRAKAEIPPEVRTKVRAVIEELIADYTNPDRGMEIRQIAGGYRMTTKPEHHDVVRAFAKSLKPPLRLSLPALETLAVIAYKQPVTSPEVGEIRGVDSQGVIATLLDRKLITTAGRKAVIGRPILYKTTKEFLMRFGLNEISELPSMEEFEKLALEAGQVDMFQGDEEDETTPAVGRAEITAVDQIESTETELPDAQGTGTAMVMDDSEQTTPEPETKPEDASTAQNTPAQSEEPVH